MKTETILERYNSYRVEIQEYMKLFIEAIVDKYGLVSEGFIVSLDLLAYNLDVMFKSIDEMKDKGMTETDKYRGEKKSGAMQAFFNSQNYIHKIIASFGLTPGSSAKIKNSGEEADMKKLLEDITKV